MLQVKTNNEKKELNRSSVGHLIKLLGVRGNLHLRKSQKIMKLLENDKAQHSPKKIYNKVQQTQAGVEKNIL